MQRLIVLLYTIVMTIFPFAAGSGKNTRITGVSIVMANMVGLWGVHVFGWHPLSLVVLYWCEGAVIGLFNVFRIMLCGIYDKNNEASIWNIRTSMLVSILFIVIFGTFMVFYGLFILDLFSQEFFERNSVSIGMLWRHRFDLFTYIVPLHLKGVPDLLESALLALAALVTSQFLIFFLHFVGKKKFAPAGPWHYLFGPFNRLLAMHFTVLLGGLVLKKIGWDSRVFVTLWVLMKTTVDEYIHVIEIKSRELNAKNA